jgi:hypothetical protein
VLFGATIAEIDLVGRLRVLKAAHGAAWRAVLVAAAA